MMHYLNSSEGAPCGSEITSDAVYPGKESPEAEEIGARAPKQWKGRIHRVTEE